MIAVCSLSVLAGCGGKSANIPPASANIPMASVAIPAGISGRYLLLTINGSALPHTVYSVGPSNKREILSDEITLSTDGTWSSSAKTRRTVDDIVSEATKDNSGTFTWNGTTVTLTNWSPNGPVSGALLDGLLTITDGALVLVYHK
jgi:hypothetical protein